MYPFNPQQILPSNKLVNEQHSVSPAGSVPFRIVQPKHGPFFKQGLVVKAGSTLLVEGVDYYLTHRFATGTHITAKPLFGSIYIVTARKGIANVGVTYDTLGGDYTTTNKVSEQVDPTSQLWEDVVGDLPFPPVNILFDIEKDEWQGEGELNTSIHGLADAIEGRDPEQQELHKWLLHRVMRLEAVWQDAQAIAHVANKNNPHGTTAWQARALDKGASSRDTLKAFGKDLQALADYINNANLPRAELNKYVKLANANTMTGSIQFRNGQFALMSDDGTSGVYFDQDSVNLIATKNVTLEAGTDGSGEFCLLVGNQKLSVGASEPAKFNDVELATVANSAELGEDAIDQGRLTVTTSNTDTLHWSGNGTSASPLTATIITTDASSTEFGVTKLATKSLTLNDSKLAATPWHVYELNRIFNGKVSASITVNGKLLSINPSLRKNDSQIGLSNVVDVSDEDMPTSSANRTSLENKSTSDHGHDLSDLPIPAATETVKGLGNVVFDIESGRKDVAIHRSVETTLSTMLDAAKVRSANLFPQGVLKIDAYGDNTYLPAPVTGSFKNMSSWRLSLPSLIEGNYLTILRLGRDENGSGLMLSYGELEPDGTCDAIINTVKEYRPNFIGPTDIIIDVLGGCSTHFMIKTLSDQGATRCYIIKTNGTMDETKHSYLEIDINGTQWPPHGTVSYYNNAVYIFSWVERCFTQIAFGSTDFELPPLSLPIAVDIKTRLVGNNFVGNAISSQWFWGTHISSDINNAPLIHSADGFYNASTNYGYSLITVVEAGYLYFKAIRDISCFKVGDTGSTRISKPVGQSFKINLDTFEATSDPSNKQVVINESGYAESYSAQGRGKNVGNHISSSISSHRSVGTVHNNMLYSFYQHASDMRVQMIADATVNSPVEYFPFGTYTLDQGNAVTKIVEGASYDGVKKPFEGTARGPLIGGKPTLIARGDNDSQIYWAETNGWGGDGYIPAGFRKKITGKQFRECGWGTFQAYAAPGKTVSGIGFTMLSDTAKGYGDPTVVGGILTRGTEYVMEAAHKAAFTSALAQYVVEESSVIDSVQCEWQIFYKPNEGIKLIVALVRDSNGAGIKQVMEFTDATFLLNGNKLEFKSTTGLTIFGYNWYSGASRTITIIKFSELRVASFISKYDNGKYGVAIHTPFTFNAPNENYYPQMAFICTKDGNTWKSNNYGSSYWSNSHPAPGDWGRIMWAVTNGSSTGTELQDKLVSWASLLANTPLGSDTARKYNWLGMLHDESWNISFYSQKRLILNGVEYLMPIVNIDLSTLPTYRSTVLYLFAELVDGVPTYNFYETPTSQNPGVKIGSIRTSATNITSIQIDYSVSLGMFRELERHIADYDDPHGIIGSSAADIGLGNLKNIPLRHEITSVNFSEIFNDWYRFSHLNSAGFPANASELQSWIYAAAKDTIYTPLNSATYIGFVSDIGYGDYRFETVVGTSQTNADNDSMTVVLAFVTDEDGKEHTLSVIRSASKEGHVLLPGTSTFSIWYNYKQTDQKQLVGTEATYAEDNGQWALRESTVKATRTGADWVVTATPISPQSNPSTVEHTLTLIGASYPELAIFNGAVRIGYGCVSQPYSSFANKRRPDTDVNNAYASREMVQGVVDKMSKRPLVVMGTVAKDVPVPIPAGYTAAQCTIIPILRILEAPLGVTGWVCGDSAVAGALSHISYGPNSTVIHSTIDYILYAE